MVATEMYDQLSLNHNIYHISRFKTLLLLPNGLEEKMIISNVSINELHIPRQLLFSILEIP